jgi:hypothetical protein
MRLHRAAPKFSLSRRRRLGKTFRQKQMRRQIERQWENNHQHAPDKAAAAENAAARFPG